LLAPVFLVSKCLNWIPSFSRSSLLQSLGHNGPTTVDHSLHLFRSSSRLRRFFSNPGKFGQPVFAPPPSSYTKYSGFGVQRRLTSYLISEISSMGPSSFFFSDGVGGGPPPLPTAFPCNAALSFAVGVLCISAVMVLSPPRTIISNPPRPPFQSSFPPRRYQAPWCRPPSSTIFSAFFQQLRRKPAGKALSFPLLLTSLLAWRNVFRNPQYVYCKAFVRVFEFCCCRLQISLNERGLSFH